MILGLSVPTFTLVHVIISLIGIGSGIIVFLAMLNRERVEGWTALFFVSTILTSVTGFFFHSKAFGPPHLFGVISLVVLALAVLGRYVFRLAAWWRLIYILGAWIALYLNSVVAVIQFFQKFAFLRPLAPTQTEPPFLITQAVMLAIFVIVGIAAGFLFRPATA